MHVHMSVCVCIKVCQVITLTLLVSADIYQTHWQQPMMLLFVVADHQWSWSMYMCRMNYNSTVPCYKWTNLFYLFKVNWALGIFDQCLHNSGLVTEHCLHEQSTTIFCDIEKI